MIHSIREISTHALTEGDFFRLRQHLSNLIFQLTPSRRATTQQEFADRLGIFQLTPSRRATVAADYGAPTTRISTHALTEGDDTSNDRIKPSLTFQLTPSRRATLQPAGDGDAIQISTHALTEGDWIVFPGTSAILHFNSRPHGGRPSKPPYVTVFEDFNSRPHGGRPSKPPYVTVFEDFNSRPHGGRPSSFVACHAAHIFQLTPSRRATKASDVIFYYTKISTHALTEGDHQ